ncbi:MAG: DNA internalization-related competence protein ComEC/Rec2 [Clostridiales bacterium]|nr:DNA internalization-related competence protein ComEC/Rec2 [Clostridiales bacterium]
MRRPICIIGLAFVLVVVVYLYISPFPAVSLDGVDKEIVTLTGQVEKKEYRISSEKEVLVVYLREIQVINPQISNDNSNSYSNNNSNNNNSNGNSSEIEGVMCYITEGVEPKTGSYICVRGKLRSFDTATNPGEFDARQYYQILKIQARLQNAIILKESESYSRFKESLYSLKSYLAALLDACYEEGDASIMKAMLLGEKSGLDTDTKQLYQLNGVIHILTISGLHISIIGMGFYKLLCKLKTPNFISIPLALSVIYCYGVMSGMGVSTFRAIIMFALNIAAVLFGRTYDMLTAMSVAGILLLIEQPLYIYHSGFLFSFGAVLAIGLLRPVVKERLGDNEKVKEVMSTTISISIATLPVYLCFYYEYPLYSIFLNLIIIPGTSLLVSDGFITCAAAVCFLPLGKITAFPAHILLAFYELCCKLVMKLPNSRNIIGVPDIWQVLIFILILCFATYFCEKCTVLQFWQFILAALLCLTIRFQDGLQITLIDVGQGDSIYICAGADGRFLIDGGSSSKSDVGTYQILPFLKEEGADTLDAVFVTHMDSDHYNGISTLIEETGQNGIKIENLILPDIDMDCRNEEYHNLEKMAAENGISVKYIHDGGSIRSGRLILTCLHPKQSEYAEDTNAASMVLYLEYEAFTALFTGDLEGTGEDAVKERLKDYIIDKNDSGSMNITVLKAAHHGSRNSMQEDFLKTISPQITLISAGRDNRYGHPHEELLERVENAGSRIFRTDLGGAVTVTYNNGRVRVECFCE